MSLQPLLHSKRRNCRKKQHSAAREQPRSPQLEKAHPQQKTQHSHNTRETKEFKAKKGSMLVAQSCPILCYPTNCSPPGSSVHGILQARILEWVAMPSSRGSSRPRSPALQADSLPSEPPGKPLTNKQKIKILVLKENKPNWR